MATLPIAPPMTVDEFVLAYGDDNRFELIDGEVCEREVDGSEHFFLKNQIKDLFGDAGIRKLGYGCFVEPSFRMTDGTGAVPDAAVIRMDRLRDLRGNPILAGAPEIAIEVSINDSAVVLERKIRDYLASGAFAVCVVYPDLRSVVVYRGQEARRLSEAETLEFPELLPGVAIPVAAIFADLEPLPHNP